MTAIIVSGHGQLSTGLLDAFEMIFGHDEKIIAVPFLKGEGIPQLQEKYQVVMDQFPDDNILFLVAYSASGRFVAVNGRAFACSDNLPARLPISNDRHIS